MKPDWKDAPEWANWLAMDANGLWYWHEVEPGKQQNEWESIGLIRSAMKMGDWVNSKEQRP